MRLLPDSNVVIRFLLNEEPDRSFLERILEKSKLSLLPKRDHILRQVGRLGLRARQMTTSELVELFYDIYNHDKVNNQKAL